MQRLPRALILMACITLIGCSAQPKQQLIGVMIDNHEDARIYQRGLDHAPIVEEQLVEGYLTRFIAFLDPDNLPEAIGPIRSVRPYFIDGSSPLVSAIFHVGGSPEALEKLQQKNAPKSYNAISNLDSLFEYDAAAPAPHNRFLLKENILKILSKNPVTTFIDPGFRSGSFKPEELATTIAIDFHNPIQNVTYTYAKQTQAYDKISDGVARPPSPNNIVILETSVEVTPEYGRLKIGMEGGGKALLFRDGGMQHGSWSKSGSDAFFVFSDSAGKPLAFAKGQIWMIVLDSLERVTWGN